MSAYFSATKSYLSELASYYSNRILGAGKEKEQALSNAVRGYFINDAKALLDSGVHPDSSKIDGKSLLEYSIEEENFEFVDLLVKYGANVHAVNDKGETALHVAARTKATAQVAENLLKAGADPNAQTIEMKHTPAHLAAMHKNQAVYEALKEDGADLKIPSITKRTAEELNKWSK